MTDQHKSPFLGFLTGAGVGAALGLLFAPRAGRETRERIADKASKSKDDFDEFLETRRLEWQQARGQAVEAASMTKSEVSDFVRFLLEEGKDLKSRLAEDLGESAEALREETQQRIKKAKKAS